LPSLVKQIHDCLVPTIDAIPPKLTTKLIILKSLAYYISRHFRMLRFKCSVGCLVKERLMVQDVLKKRRGKDGIVEILATCSKSMNILFLLEFLTISYPVVFVVCCSSCNQLIF
jgi:hypothetical protein